MTDHHAHGQGTRLRRLLTIVALVAAALAVGVTTSGTGSGAHPVQAASGVGANLLMTGHDADFHCSQGDQQCHYVKIAVNFVRNGSSLPILVFDRCSPPDNPDGSGCNEVAAAIALAFPTNAPKLVQVDPRSAAFKTTPFIGPQGQRIYSAIIVASDTTCGGCDLNDYTTNTPDTNALISRKADFAKAFNAGTGILALAGACHANGGPNNGCDSSDTTNNFYNFLPIVPTGAAVNPPFQFTALGLKMGFVQDQDNNCCATHNSFQIPPASSPLKVAEKDSQGFAETLVASGASICGSQFCGAQPQGGRVDGGTACTVPGNSQVTCTGAPAGTALKLKIGGQCSITGPAPDKNSPMPTACSGVLAGGLGSSSFQATSFDTGSGLFPSGTCTTSSCPDGGTVSLSGKGTYYTNGQQQSMTFTFNGTDDDPSGNDSFTLSVTPTGGETQTYSWTCMQCLEITVNPLPAPTH